ncbi:MAG TPA: 4-oxalocrotonate tautomerase family protein [Dehalococcoidia bacterium]|nr:4-oxalocrotonate tautomerase family protein [Dehalococcoidia bacterium]
MGQSTRGAKLQSKTQQEEAMPIIRIEMWKGRSQQQKRDLARLITDAMVTIGQTTPEATIIVFDDVEKENWAQGGTLAVDE